MTRLQWTDAKAECDSAGCFAHRRFSTPSISSRFLLLRSVDTIPGLPITFSTELTNAKLAEMRSALNQTRFQIEVRFA